MKRLTQAFIICFLALRLLVLTDRQVAAANALPNHFLPWNTGVAEYVSQGNNQGTHVGLEQYAWDFAGSWTIRATVGGTVLSFVDSYSSSQSGCGQQYANYANYVTIQEGQYVDLYLHLAQGSVTGKISVGQTIGQYTAIGTSDSTGWVCGANPAHLRYMVETNCGSWYCQSVASSFSDPNVLSQDSNGVPLTGQTVTSGNSLPANTNGSSMGAMAASDPSGNEVFYAFVPRSVDGHLRLNYYSVGTGWTWVDMSSSSVSKNPPSTALVGRVAQISFIDGSGVLRQYAFVGGANGHLYVDWYSTTGWQWSDQSSLTGAPSFVSEVIGTGTFVESSGSRDLYVFVRDSAGAVWLNFGGFSSGVPQSWANLSTLATPYPSGSPALPAMSAGIGSVAGVTTTGIHALYAFAEGTNGHLYLFYWNDQSNTWLGIDEHIETAFTGVTVTGRVGVDSFVDNSSVLRVYGFVIGSTNHVYINYYDGTGSRWSDQGLLNSHGVTPVDGVGVTHFRGSDGTIGVYAAAIGADSNVYLNYGGLVPTAWSSLPAYSGLTPIAHLGVTSFVSANNGPQALYIMTIDSVVWSNVEQDVQLDYWNSSNPNQWQALDQGAI